MSTEHPIYAPFRGEHLAAVVTVPDSTPRSMVLLLQGIGAPRSHRYGLWTRISRDLANRGIASVRLDYPEMGDSTGSFPSDMNAPPVDEAMCLAELGLGALGLDSFGIAGNCLGARTALGVATRMDSCVSIGCVLPSSPKSVLRGAGRTAPHRAAGRVAKRVPRFARVVRRHVDTEHIQPRLRFVPEVPTALRSARILFLYLGKEETGRLLEQGVGALIDHEGDIPSDRALVKTIPATGTSGMRLSLALQPLVIDSLVNWMDETLPATSQRDGAGRRDGAATPNRQLETTP